MASCSNHNMKREGTVIQVVNGKPVEKGYYVCQNPGCSHTEQR